MKIFIFCLTCFFCNYSALSQNKAAFVVDISNPSNDTIQIKVEENATIWEWDTNNLLFQNGRYQGNLPISKASFFYLTEGNNYVYGFVEPGDSIVIQYEANNLSQTLSFGGNKKSALKIYNEFLQFKLRDKVKSQLPLAKQKPYPFDHLFHYLDSLENHYLNQLRKNNLELSEEAMVGLTGNIKAQFLSNRYNSVSLVYHESIEQTIANRASELTKYSLQQIQALRQFDEKYYQVSAYVNSVYNILFKHYDGLQLEGRADKSLTKKFAFLRSQLPPKLRIPVLTMFIDYEMGKTNDANEIQSIIESYFINAADETFNSYVNSKFQSLVALKKGLPAPAFMLEDELGEEVTLDALKGKVVYMDFWFASCVPCHVLFGKLKTVKEYFQNHPQVIFLNVSIDPEKLWKASLQKFQIKGYHVFTRNKGSDHAIIKDYKVVQYPTTFLIDKTGRIYNATPPDDPNELIMQIEQMLKQ